MQGLMTMTISFVDAQRATRARALSNLKLQARTSNAGVFGLLDLRAGPRGAKSIDSVFTIQYSVSTGMVTWTGKRRTRESGSGYHL